MEKNLIYTKTVIKRVFDDVELTTFFKNVIQVQEKTLEMFPEAANHKIRLEFDEEDDYIVVSLGYYRYETDEEYHHRITKPERERQDRLNKLYAQIEQDKEAVIDYLKTKGEI